MTLAYELLEASPPIREKYGLIEYLATGADLVKSHRAGKPIRRAEPVGT